MPVCSFEYSIIRVMPRVERGEFINVGAVVSCRARRYLEARIDYDPERLRSFAPALDLELVADYLATIPLVCRGGPGSGGIGALPQQERFHWMVAPRSTIIQLAPVHSGFCESPELALEHVLETLVRPPKS